MNPALLTPKQAAEYLSTTPGALSQWRYMSMGPAFMRHGRTIRYRQQDLDAFIEANLVATTDAPRLRVVQG